MNTRTLLTYLDLRRLPVADEAQALSVHQSLCAEAPRLYLALLADRSAHVTHLRLGLVTLLTHPVAREQTTPAEIVRRLRALHDRGLEVVEALALRRPNGRHARQVGLSALLGSPHLARWAATRRRRMIRLLRHLLGERTFTALGRALASSAAQDEGYARRVALRFAADQGEARQALTFLTGVEADLSHPELKRALLVRISLAEGQGLPKDTLMGLRGTYFPKAPRSDVVKLSAVAPARRSQGALARILRAGLLGEVDLVGAEALALAEAESLAGGVDRLDGKLALVLDLSASMASSGERHQHPASLALALTRLLQLTFAGVSVHTVGGPAADTGDGPCPRPRGASDLAMAMLDAARERPEVMVLLTDGYENVRQGDADQVMRGLERLGMAPALIQGVTVFTPQEDISERRPVDRAPALPVAHEADVGEIAVRATLARCGEQLEAEAPLAALLAELLCEASKEMEVSR